VTYFVILGPPPYLGNWLKLETSNLACRLATEDLNKIIQNYVKRGHMTYFLNFGTPFISRERLKLETSNLAHKLATWGLNGIMQN